MSVEALFNGAAADGALAHHRGLHYGDGIFRTCLIYTSQVHDIEGQLHKASADASVLGLVVDDAALRREAAALAEGMTRGVLKILLLRRGGERGYRSAGQAADRLLCRYPLPVLPAAAATRGVRVARSAQRLAAQPTLAGIKHLNRLEQVLASRQWPAGADEVLLADAEGRPVAGTRTNLFWISGGALRTPRLDACGVAGYMRDKVLAAAAALAIPSEVAPGSWDELEAADEVFLSNSLVGLWPVAALEARRWAAPGPVTRRLMAHLRHPELG